jgi:hypothetical protein
MHNRLNLKLVKNILRQLKTFSFSGIFVTNWKISKFLKKIEFFFQKSVTQKPPGGFFSKLHKYKHDIPSNGAHSIIDYSTKTAQRGTPNVHKKSIDYSYTYNSNDFFSEDRLDIAIKTIPDHAQ